MYDTTYAQYLTSLKNRENRTGTVKRAVPIRPDDLTIMNKYVEESGKFSLTQILWWKAYGSTAFKLWSRYARFGSSFTALALTNVLAATTKPPAYK